MRGSDFSYFQVFSSLYKNNAVMIILLLFTRFCCLLGRSLHYFLMFILDIVVMCVVCMMGDKTTDSRNLLLSITQLCTLDELFLVIKLENDKTSFSKPKSIHFLSVTTAV